MVYSYQRHQKIRQIAEKQRQNKNQLSLSNLDILKNKPFWIWDKQEHLKVAQETNQQCCSIHIVGLPINQKTGLQNPLFDYEKILYDNLMYSNLKCYGNYSKTGAETAVTLIRQAKSLSILQPIG